jgi:hypothetical protein
VYILQVTRFVTSMRQNVMRKQLKAGELIGSRDIDGLRDICSGALSAKRPLFCALLVLKGYFRAVRYALHSVGHR